MFDTNTHSIRFSLKANTAIMQGVIYIARRVTRCNHNSLSLNHITTSNNAHNTTIFHNQLFHSLFEVHLTACRTDSIAHIGDNSRQSIRADVRMRLVQNFR